MNCLVKMTVYCGTMLVLTLSASAQNARVSGQSAGSLPSVASQASLARALSVKRYRRKLLSHWTEYNPITCEPISTGSWTIEKQPKHGKLILGTITGPIGGCDGTFTFAAIYYKWTKHNNKAVTDRVKARWKTPDGKFDHPIDYRPRVPVVRPIGERSIFSGWADTRANWMQKLIPPKDDPSFDFSGEQVREVHRGHTSTCHLTPGASMGPTGVSRPAKPWTVGAGNRWGPDQVGWAPCAVAVFRCIKQTPCGYRLTQHMQIKSPVDKNWTTYAINTLGGDIEGGLFSIPGFPNKDKSGIGSIFSLRGKGGRKSKFWRSSERSCPAGAKLPC